MMDAQRLAKKAAQAHTNLNTFHAVINLLEGGLLYGERQAPVRQIISICKREAGLYLEQYDSAMAALSQQARP